MSNRLGKRWRICCMAAATALVLGLDIGQAIAPLIFGVMMDHGQYRGVLLGVQAVLIVSAFNLGRVRRTALASV